MMDCRQTRTLFSEHQDSRLPRAARTAMEAHLETCPPCREEWGLYHCVYDAVPQFAELPSERLFELPREEPGSRDRVGWSEGRWGRVRVAAAVLVLLGLTHVAVFEFARNRTPNVEPFRPLVGPEAGAGNAARLQTVSASPIPSKVRDRLDTASLCFRQIAQMPEDAYEEGRHLVLANLDLLKESEGLDRELRDLGVASSDFLTHVDRFESNLKELRGHLEGLLSASRSGPALVPLMQRALEGSQVTDAMERLFCLPSVASAPRGATWRQDGRMRQLNRIGSAASLKGDVKSFLNAHGNLLIGDYLSASRAFRKFREVETRSRLTPLACYMEAECFRQMGLYEQAYRVMLQPQTRIRFRVVVPDPLISAFVVFGGQSGLVIHQRPVGIFATLSNPASVNLMPYEVQFAGDLSWSPPQEPAPPSAETDPFFDARATRLRDLR